MKIFSYGSNMNIERLKKRTPSAMKLSNGFLKEYQFKCNKVSNTGSSKGNIVFTGSSNDIVWSVIFDIADKEKKSLDDAEGLGNGYNETKIVVHDSKNEPLIIKAN